MENRKYKLQAQTVAIQQQKDQLKAMDAMFELYDFLQKKSKQTTAIQNMMTDPKFNLNAEQRLNLLAKRTEINNELVVKFLPIAQSIGHLNDYLNDSKVKINLRYACLITLMESMQLTAQIYSFNIELRNQSLIDQAMSIYDTCNQVIKILLKNISIVDSYYKEDAKSTPQDLKLSKTVVIKTGMLFPKDIQLSNVFACNAYPNEKKISFALANIAFIEKIKTQHGGNCDITKIAIFEAAALAKLAELYLEMGIPEQALKLGQDLDVILKNMHDAGEEINTKLVNYFNLYEKLAACALSKGLMTTAIRCLTIPAALQPNDEKSKILLALANDHRSSYLANIETALSKLTQAIQVSREENHIRLILTNHKAIDEFHRRYDNKITFMIEGTEQNIIVIPNATHHSLTALKKLIKNLTHCDAVIENSKIKPSTEKVEFIQTVVKESKQEVEAPTQATEKKEKAKTQGIADESKKNPNKRGDSVATQAATPPAADPFIVPDLGEKYAPYRDSMQTFFNKYVPAGIYYGFIPEEKFSTHDKPLVESSKKVLAERCLVSRKNQAGIKPYKNGFKIKCIHSKNGVYKEIMGKSKKVVTDDGKEVIVVKFNKVMTHNSPGFG